MNAKLWSLVLLLVVLSAMSDGHEFRSSIPTPLEDTNAYVCPPSASGRVMYDGHTGSYTKYPGAISYGVIDSRYFSAHGYVSFALAGFPDSAVMISVRLWYYQYEHDSYGGGLPSTSVVLIPDVNAPAQQLFQDISNGTVVDTRAYTGEGWVVRSFNSAGLAAVDSCIRVGDAIDIGINGGGCAYGAAYGAGPFDPRRAYLEVRYTTAAQYSDVVAIDALFGSNPYAVGDSVVAVSRFLNTGNRAALGFLILTSLSGVVDTVDVDSLAPNETLRVRAVFPPRTAPGSIKVTACSRVTSDWCPHNDTAVATTYVFPQGTRSAECFELDYTPSFPPSGWLVYNGGDTSTWHRGGPADRYAHSGDFYATCARSDRTEDWLITYGLSPNSSTADTVGVFFSTPYSWCYPQVWALGSQNTNDILGLLLDTVIQTQGWCEKHIGLDQLDGRTVFVGFRNCATAGGPLCLDDVWFTSERASAIEEPASARTPALKISLGQNPITGDRVVVRYHTPNPLPLTVEVADVLGRTVARQRLPATSGRGQFDLAARNWPAGAYFVRVTSGAASASVKCIVRGRNP
jgi:hypothetical protein